MPSAQVQEMKFEKVSEQFESQPPTNTVHPLRYPNVTNFAMKSAPGSPLTAMPEPSFGEVHAVMFADSKVEGALKVG
jgi:hypothetical protein